MKITALLVLKSDSSASSSSSATGGTEPLVLANATDVSHFGYFQRGAAKEFILFVARTVAKRNPPGQRQSVQHEGYSLRTVLFPDPLTCPAKIWGKNCEDQIMENIRSLGV